MNLQQYQIDASRSIVELGDRKLDIAHMIFGMVGELNEFFDAYYKEDKVNIGEELTDIHWFLANYCRMNDVSYAELGEMCEGYVFIGNEQDVFNELTIQISTLTDLEKRKIVYGKDYNRDVWLETLKDIFTALKKGYQLFDLDMFQCLENNINKLKIRFPDKFDAQLAINRDHVKERVALEQISPIPNDITGYKADQENRIA